MPLKKGRRSLLGRGWPFNIGPVASTSRADPGGVFLSEVVVMSTLTARRPQELDAPLPTSTAQQATRTWPSRCVAARLSIPDIHCWECSGHLELALEAVRGIEKAEVYADTRVALIRFVPELVELVDIVAGIRKAGYESIEVVSVDRPTSGGWDAAA
jgi:copper chaperone CopZ